MHEWRCRRRLIKFEIVDQLLTEWFTKSFVAPISHDISMGGSVMEEQAIARAHYFYLIYSQSVTLYELLPDVSRPSFDAMALKS